MKMEDFKKGVFEDVCKKYGNSPKIQEKLVQLIDVHASILRIREVGHLNYPKDMEEEFKLETRGLLLTFPKFVWDLWDSVPSIGKMTGYEMCFSLLLFYLSEKYSGADKSFIEFLAEIIGQTMKEDEDGD